MLAISLEKGEALTSFEFMRVLSAPRERVFDALTRPELLKRWNRTPGLELQVCEVDLRVGGRFRFLWRGPQGKELSVRGVYRQIVPPARLVHTESVEPPWYQGEALVETVLREKGGRTTLFSRVRLAGA